MAGDVLGRWPDVEDDDVPVRIRASSYSRLIVASRERSPVRLTADQTTQVSGLMAWGVEQLGQAGEGVLERA
jgi:hypothetical protein